MKFSLATVVGFAAAVFAKVEISNSVIDPVAGKSFELTWVKADGPVTIELVHGASTDLKKDQVLASGLDPKAGSFTWNVPKDIVARGDYAFHINDGSNDNWSLQFALAGTGAASSSAAPTSSVASTTATSAASSSAASSASTEAASSTLTTTVTSEVSSSAMASKTSSVHKSETHTSAAASASASGSNVPDTNKAGRLGSPIALVLTLAAMVYFH